MLQGTNLPFIDIQSLDSGLNNTASEPGQGIGPDAGFVDIFKMQPRPATDPEAGAGRGLPSNGNYLPLHPADLALDESLDSPEPGSALPDVSATAAFPMPPLIPTMPPLAATPLVPESTLQQHVLAASQSSPAAPLLTAAVVPESATALAAVPEPVPPAPTGQLLNGASTPPLEADAGAPVLIAEPALRARIQTEAHPPLPSAEAHLRRDGAELPILPISSKAAAKLPEQPAAAKKTAPDLGALLRDVDPAAPPRLASDPSGEERLQGVKVTSPVPPGPHSPAAVPVSSADTPSVQQIQMSPTLLTQVSGPTDGDTGLPIPQSRAMIGIPVGETGWGDRIGDRLLLMASNKTQSAEIRLTPAELGPLRVRVAMDDGAATVIFHAQHAVTRDALDNAMPRLRELFAENGLTLQQSNIAGSDGHGVQQGTQDQDDNGTSAGAVNTVTEDGSASDDISSIALVSRMRSDKLVDTFV